MPRTPFFLASLFLLCSLLCSCAAAANVSVSFSDINLVHSQEFDLYRISTTGEITHLGTFNATDTVLELDDAYSYQAVLKPSKWSWLDDPITAIDGGLRTAPPILSFFLICVIILLPALLLLRRL
ncbi:MAG: hypothetical protein AB9861_19115 [Methanosarcina sp.]|jgi:hypothetical protein